MRLHVQNTVFISLMVFFSAFGFSREFESSKLDKITVVDGVPWSIEPIDEHRFLIALRQGDLIILDGQTGAVTPVSGVPEVYASGQGGLMDVIVSPTDNDVIYFTYAKPIDKGGAPTLAKARLNGSELVGWQDLFSSNVVVTSGRHFGSRLAFDDEGDLYMTIGDAGERDNAQQTQNHAGSIIRLDPDGSVPKDNPFVDNSDVAPEIYSYGHRNPQGIVYDKKRKQLWAIEHGPRGGDELNLIHAGANYGWPITSHGKEYWGPISAGEAQEKEGIEPPKKVYIPSIAPGSLFLYQGEKFPRLNGILLIGALKLTHLNILDVNEAGQVLEERRYYEDLGERIRDITADSEGNVWLTADSGTIYKISRAYE
ncbi:Soluble aldose sugar dehydrogenase YliI precursor [Vibrio thalassae]|uniref:Soluble aldose sugar dehydrogenase YliI n=1 Tax=Vibrio thalassae TaxID=1243014 RepID=A0A240EQT2_9VIBR|nr:PQQ-dependent sugar dehydrogenase [Vibrio thalassae]SNX50643.1 Soluble aldose sugar dehydrogenase YliI precursor [Vibrio thalassae]